MSSKILKITDPISSDESIDKYEDTEYEPVTVTNLNNHGGDIRLVVQNQASQRELFDYRRATNKE